LPLHIGPRRKRHFVHKEGACRPIARRVPVERFAALRRIADEDRRHAAVKIEEGRKPIAVRHRNGLRRGDETPNVSR